MIEPIVIKITIDFLEERFCAYCGRNMKTSYDEYELYYYCDCEDIKKIEELNRQINKLENDIRMLENKAPKEKYKMQKYIKKICDC